MLQVSLPGQRLFGILSRVSAIGVRNRQASENVLNVLSEKFLDASAIKRCHVIREPAVARVPLTENGVPKGKGRRDFSQRPLFNAGNDLLSHTLSRAVQSAQRGLTSVFGMGTGGTPAVRSPTTRSCQLSAVRSQQLCAAPTLQG